MSVDAPALVAGVRHAAHRSYDTVDPATGKPLASVADCTTGDVDRAARAAADAVPAWSATDLAARCQVLRLAAERLRARRDELIELAVADAGARLPVATSTQVDAAISRIQMWSDMPADALRLPDPAPANGLTSEVHRRPVGVVGCISPYNFPLLAMIGKVAPALFAGNAVLMKPAPQDPLLVVALGEAIAEGLAAVGAPAGVASVLTGAAAQLGAAVVEHPLVGAVSFTGSTTVGHAISESAAPAMKSLALELGGKGACVIRADADPEAAADALVRTWTVQSGQVCLTPARVVADAAVHDTVVDALLDRLATMRMGDPHDASTTVGPLISSAQRDKVERLVDTARAEGAAVHRHGHVPDLGYFVAPTLVTGCTTASTVMQEEAFGPVLAVTRTESDEEAVAVANSTRYALSDYVFSADEQAAAAMAARLHSGQVSINSTQRHGNAPFGGNRDSGFGRSGGRYSLDSVTTVQTLTSLESTPENTR